MRRLLPGLFLVVVAALAQSCGSSTCKSACDKVGSCLEQAGYTFDGGACVNTCTSVQGGEAAADCINGIDGCNGPAIQQCLGGGAAGGGNDCNGCVRDGNDCVWISQGDWGTGPNSPYSGAVITCNAGCCP